MSGVLVGAIVAAGGVLLLILVVVVIRAVAGSRRPVCPSCGRAAVPTWTRCPFCQASLSGEATLEVLAGPLRGEVFRLTAAEVNVGSIAGNDVVIPDPAISRHHARFQRDGMRYEILDLGSTNGVYVNGRKVPRRRLAGGEVVRLGTTDLVFRVYSKVV